MMTATAKLTVWAPRTPGAAESVIGTADKIADARKIAAQFAGRRDLKRQDVVIRLGHDGKIIERCGPCR